MKTVSAAPGQSRILGLAFPCGTRRGNPDYQKPVAFLRPYRPPLMTAERVNGFPDVPDRYPRFTDRHTIELRKGCSNRTHDGKKAIQHVIDVMSKGLPWGTPYKGSTATRCIGGDDQLRYEYSRLCDRFNI